MKKYYRQLLLMRLLCYQIKKIKVAFKRYIIGALEWSDIYIIIMTSSKQNVLKVTSVLSKSFSYQSKGLDILKETINEGMESKIFRKGNPLLVAQCIWSSVFGLVTK